ncbi:MAG: transcription termination factor NusA [Candidatus Acidulodesulfobacterium ferriphilum]|uniref:Transcription termination/antitermination protein NusA n=1 Tax=Candidatus Acidulodesulfobacterium ferriphilum TaxID=2597223 RepID=A0A519B9R2_9DELT|nr:MAG: transcription termination factor NusA [Candidatus Acidulodesulfobacterium ferriphilum]
MSQLIINDLSSVIDQVSKDKNIDRSLVIEALEQAILAIARKNLGIGYDLEAHYTEETGEIEVFMFKQVVDEVKNPRTEISVKDAVKNDPDAIVGDSLGLKVEKNIYGRIEAQVAKQVIFQKIKEIEHKNIFDEFNERKGEIVSGLVRKVEKSMIIVDLGKTEAILPKQEQIYSETYKPNDRIRAVLSNIKMEKGGPKLILSRASDEFLIKLFELEVPEIYDGAVKIVRVARAPGFRSKIAVYTTDKDIDPVGACVGVKGFRIQSIINELRGEKIDIIPYSDNPAKLVVNALSPAEVSKVAVNEDTKTITVIVPDDQLALAIGKQGQNVRLATKITDYKIDINSESKAGKKDQSAYKALMDIPGIGDIIAKLLYQSGYSSVEDIANASVSELVKDISVDAKKAEKIINSAGEFLARIKSDMELKEKIDKEIN